MGVPPPFLPSQALVDVRCLETRGDIQKIPIVYLSPRSAWVCRASLGLHDRRFAATSVALFDAAACGAAAAARVTPFPRGRPRERSDRQRGTVQARRLSQLFSIAGFQNLAEKEAVI